MYATTRRDLTRIVAILAIIPSIVFAVTASASSGEWMRVQANTTLNLNGVFGAASYAHAVGANGTMIRYDGSQWTLVFTPTTTQLNAVWSASAADAFIVGDNGSVFRYDGSAAVRELSFTSTNLNGVWGTSSSDVVAVGDNGSIFEFDGDSWTRAASVTASRLRGVHSTDGVTFVVGDNGIILRRTDMGWARMDTPTTRNLFAVWVRAADDAFAAGDFGSILRYDGSAWRLMDTPTTLGLTGVWGLSDRQVFAVGDNGTILEFDGSAWAKVLSGTSLPLTAIFNGFAVGRFGTVLNNLATRVEFLNLRFTEVDPASGRVEVTNSGPAFTTGDHPFSHRLDHDSFIPIGTSFATGGIEVFEVTGLKRSASDLWLYRRGPFGDARNIVHGLKWGTSTDVGYTRTAVDADLWPSTDAFAPVPGARATLAWDGFGIDPKDWYIDETPTLGAPDFTEPATVPRKLDFPRGAQDFEFVSLGDEAFAIADWTIDNSSAPGAFTARFVHDVDGDVTPRDGSTRWLRVRDQDAGEAVNRVSTPVVVSESDDAYAWSFWFNVEEAPSAGGVAPRFVLEHAAGMGFTGTWGIEVDSDYVSLFVSADGGKASYARLVRTSDVVGEWTRVDIDAILVEGRVSATINGQHFDSLPIDPRAYVDPRVFRLSYIGSGEGNAATILIDDISLEAEIVAVPFGVFVEAVVLESDVTLTWKVNGWEDVDGFAVYRRTDGANERMVAGPLAPTTRRFDDANLPSDHTYSYDVGAIKSDGSEVRSAVSHIRVEPIPVAVFGRLHMRTVGSRVEIAWQVAANEAIAGFRVYRRAATDVNDIEATAGALLPPGTRGFVDAGMDAGRTYYYCVGAVNAEGRETRSEWAGVQTETPRVNVSRVFPNPFTSATQFELNLPVDGRVSVVVYDVQGKRVATLMNGLGRAGSNVMSWDGRNSNGRAVSAGTYFFRVEAPGTTLTQKVVLVR